MKKYYCRLYEFDPQTVEEIINGKTYDPLTWVQVTSKDDKRFRTLLIMGADLNLSRAMEEQATVYVSLFDSDFVDIRSFADAQGVPPKLMHFGRMCKFDFEKPDENKWSVFVGE